MRKYLLIATSAFVLGAGTMAYVGQTARATTEPKAETYHMLELFGDVLDQVDRQYVSEVDDKKRTALFQQVEKTFNSELPWAPLWVQKRYGIVSAAVHNFVWTPAPGGGSYDQHAETWAFG